jgi:hypothetical protein
MGAIPRDPVIRLSGGESGNFIFFDHWSWNPDGHRVANGLMNDDGREILTGIYALLAFPAERTIPIKIQIFSYTLVDNAEEDTIFTTA